MTIDFSAAGDSLCEPVEVDESATWSTIPLEHLPSALARINELLAPGRCQRWGDCYVGGRAYAGPAIFRESRRRDLGRHIANDSYSRALVPKALRLEAKL